MSQKRANTYPTPSEYMAMSRVEQAEYIQYGHYGRQHTDGYFDALSDQDNGLPYRPADVTRKSEGYCSGYAHAYGRLYRGM
jgi:hypothetical protein